MPESHPSPFAAFVGGRPHKALAEFIGVAPSQVHQWIAGVRVPDPTRIGLPVLREMARTVGRLALPGLLASGAWSRDDLAEIGALVLVCREAIARRGTSGTGSPGKDHPR